MARFQLEHRDHVAHGGVLQDRQREMFVDRNGAPLFQTALPGFGEMRHDRHVQDHGALRTSSSVTGSGPGVTTFDMKIE